MTRRLQPTLKTVIALSSRPFAHNDNLERAHSEAAVGELTFFTSSDARSTHRNQKFRVSRCDTSLETSIDS